MLAGFALGCQGDVTTSPQEFTVNLDRDEESRCRAVNGVLNQSGTPGPLVGTISGDIEGTVVTIGGPAIEHGVVVSRPVRQTWTITGGIVEPLIGRTLAIEGDFVGITAHLPVLRVNTRARVVEGAQRGNLTYHGTTDLSAFPLVTSELTYHGVICP